MAEVKLSLQARLDLLSILEHLTDVTGPQIARAYDTRFKRVVENLSRRRVQVVHDHILEPRRA